MNDDGRPSLSAPYTLSFLYGLCKAGQPRPSCQVSKIWGVWKIYTNSSKSFRLFSVAPGLAITETINIRRFSRHVVPGTRVWMGVHRPCKLFVLRASILTLLKKISDWTLVKHQATSMLEGAKLLLRSDLLNEQTKNEVLTA